MASNAVQPKVEARMTTYELSETVEFRRLSPKMAAWVLAYVQSFIDTGTFDPLTATQVAYTCTTVESARIFGYQLMANPKIRLTLTRFFGTSAADGYTQAVKTERDKLINVVRKQLRAAEKGSVAASKFTTQLERLLLGIKPGPVGADEDEPEATPAINGGTANSEHAEAAPNVSDSRVPAGAKPLHDKTGTLKGYISAAGEYVQLAAVEVAK